MHKLLKFRYFLSFFILFSCGESSEKKSNTANESENSEQKEIITTNDDKTILFFGDSLTAGMGLDPENAFPALIQEKLDSLGYGYSVINSGLSGETTTSGKNRLDWVLNQNTDIFILELGANDGLRGIPLSETRKNLQDIIDAVHEKNPETQIIMAGMQIPPNMGPEYTEEFKKIFPELAEKNNLLLIPFLLEGVAGDPNLNQADGIHPTIEGHKIVSSNTWQVLKDILK
ncbi:arylesterase [Aurantibacter crassamenti]|uniref:arylesterase n=1 Tax=Aurantibacter crassamenti TaxID=1837375 RepID=UPI0019398976|nr:arylesterase [Aurantibacter crassamenti]MBM1106466.1 arylesterase [Aurantibacter crassamenti]